MDTLVRNIRRACGLSRQGFAQELGVSPGAVGRWERGAAFVAVFMLLAAAAGMDKPFRSGPGRATCSSGCSRRRARRPRASAPIPKPCAGPATSNATGTASQAKAAGRFTGRRTRAPCAGPTRPSTAWIRPWPWSG
ncbi:MAG: helix-turn-helix transcriptional regulator [Duodenibacillus sp.]|nr:helix-turn-helix transcriptional regulator [Duodenibacillus sp.]